MDEKDDGLALSLSLKFFPEENQNFEHQRPPASATAPEKPSPLIHFSFPLPFMQPRHESAGDHCTFFLRGMDVNHYQALPAVDCGDEEEEEEVMGMSPNSSVSSDIGRRKRLIEGEENDGERAFCSPDMEDDGGDAAARKKLRLSKEQAVVLEETFNEHNTLNPKQKMGLAKQLNLRPRQVEVWFQNRRARTKLKQREVDHDYLRRCCEDLSEENRRLHKEIKDLRAMKLSLASPPTTLTMCPQCKRVAASSTSSSTSSSITASSSHHRQKQSILVASQAMIIPHLNHSMATVPSEEY